MLRFLDGGTLRAINILDPESYLKGVCLGKCRLLGVITEDGGA